MARTRRSPMLRAMPRPQLLCAAAIAKGAALRSKLKAKSFTLVARYVENCDATFFGSGTCKTEWTYKANFRKAGKKKRR